MFNGEKFRLRFALNDLQENNIYQNNKPTKYLVQIDKKLYFLIFVYVIDTHVMRYFSVNERKIYSYFVYHTVFKHSNYQPVSVVAA